jgi:hypothetical protein
MASYYLWRGADKDGKAPSGDSNYLNATGSGTLASPSIITTATAAGWGTYANKVTDFFKIVGDLAAAGYNIGSSVAFYPKSAHARMNGHGATEQSAIQMLMEQGVMGAIALDDQYLYTAAGADPTNALFDLYAVDLSKVVIGYTRTERSQVIAPHDEVRDTLVECEVWFTPYLVPVPKSGAITKGVSRITAIA